MSEDEDLAERLSRENVERRALAHAAMCARRSALIDRNFARLPDDRLPDDPRISTDSCDGNHDGKACAPRLPDPTVDALVALCRLVVGMYDRGRL